jgi:hypothetical protein
VKLFSCDACGQTLYFHNVTCTACGHAIGFVPQKLELMAFETGQTGAWHPVVAKDETYRPCANYRTHNACNWMVPASFSDEFCLSCRLNRTIPDLSVARNRLLWQRLQTEKNRLVYSLLRLSLPISNKQESPALGLAFDVLGDPNPRFSEDSSIITGHSMGIITLDIAEADDAVREKVRQKMAEPYRTVLGHLRHESGHYYWDRLVHNSDWLTGFRERFGDERMDYDEALRSHYASGPPTGWTESYVSSYATSHPWEDWAESWAHYLHMIDTLETAWQFGLRLAPETENGDELTTTAAFDPYTCSDFKVLADCWLPLTVALNSLSRSMGQSDLYPFVLTPAIMQKLQFVHDITRDTAQEPERQSQSLPVS